MDHYHKKWHWLADNAGADEHVHLCCESKDDVRRAERELLVSVKLVFEQEWCVEKGGRAAMRAAFELCTDMLSF